MKYSANCTIFGAGKTVETIDELLGYPANNISDVLQIGPKLLELFELERRKMSDVLRSRYLKLVFRQDDGVWLQLTLDGLFLLMPVPDGQVKLN